MPQKHQPPVQPEPITLPTDPESFQTQLLAEIAAIEQRLGCRIGLSYKDGSLPLEVNHNGDSFFHAASTMKVPVMIEIFRLVDAGELSLDDEVIFDPICHSLIDGSPFECDARDSLTPYLNKPVPYRDLVEYMIIESDNLATNILIERANALQITKTMRELGAEHGYVMRGVQDIKAFRAGISNQMTPRDLTTLMEAIDKDRAASPESSEAMRGVLSRQKYTSQIPGNMPEEARVGNKTGSITGNRHDTAIVWGPDFTFYLTILMDGVENSREATRESARLSRWIYDTRKAMAEGS